MKRIRQNHPRKNFAMIASVTLQALNEKIVDVVGSRVELKPRGRKFFGLCPFHPDRTPSFEVVPDKAAWFCNVCNLGGDAISFIERFHSTDFRGACRILGLNEDRIPKWKLDRFFELKRAAEDARDRLLLAIAKRRDENAELSRETNFILNEKPDSEFLGLEMLRLDLEFDALDREEEFVKEIFEERMSEIRRAIL